MKCSGCGACALICPRQCLTMEKDKNGFLRPFRDEMNCSHCGLCARVCPLQKENGKNLDDMSLYSAWSADNSIRLKSSSGGIAYCLAKHAIELGYGVCGVCLDYTKMEAEHVIARNIQDIEKFRGSKYLQSNNTSAFLDVINKLKANRSSKFLVFGTPCQIAGLDLVLQTLKLRARVLLVDIYCHGVPSDLLWKKYLNILAKKLQIDRWENISYFSFRDKKYSWHNYYMHVVGKGKKSFDYLEIREKDPFLKLFTMGVVNQQSCFTCPFRNRSAADIRLGDYWGARFENCEDGVSMVLVSTKMGEDALQSIEDKLILSEQQIADRFSQQHTDIVYPEYYDDSMKMLRDKDVSLQKIINLYESDWDRLKKKIKKLISK